MYEISSKIKNGGIWYDGKLVTFNKGVLTTNDTALAGLCEKQGFTVTGEPDNKGKFTDMDVAALKAYAAEKSIDIGNSTSVNGIIKKIEDAEAKA